MAHDHLALGRQTGIVQAPQAGVEHRLVVRLLLGFDRRAEGPGLDGHHRHRRRHNRHQMQARLAPLADLLAVEQCALPRFGAVVGEHDGLVDEGAPYTADDGTALCGGE